MSENLDRRERDFSRFDSMTTEELQQILRLDAKKPHGEESDTDELFYIMEVLANRKRNDRNFTGKTVQQSYEEFQKHYLPCDGSVEDIDFLLADAHPANTKKTSACWLRGLTAAAAILAVIFVSSFTAKAFGFDLAGRMAIWSKDFFHFADETQATEATDPAKKNELKYASVQEVLAQYGIEEGIIPAQIPYGYILEEINIASTPKAISINALYRKDDIALKITIRKLLDEKPLQIEKNDDLIQIYDSGSISYYIFSNDKNLQAVWIVDHTECAIAGNISLDEMKAILDLI